MENIPSFILIIESVLGETKKLHLGLEKYLNLVKITLF